MTGVTPNRRLARPDASWPVGGTGLRSTLFIRVDAAFSVAFRGGLCRADLLRRACDVAV